MTGGVGGVLLVVDEDDRREAEFETLLAEDGVTVLRAKTVGQAVELLQALGTACCVLISMTLPARGGWTLLSRLRSDRTPENACSAIIYGPSAVIDGEPLNAPIIAKLATPLDLALLRELVVEHCGVPRVQSVTA